MFKWIGRGKRLERKMDEILSHYGPSPLAGSAEKSPPANRGFEPILMTEEREEKIADEIEKD